MGPTRQDGRRCGTVIPGVVRAEATYTQESYLSKTQYLSNREILPIILEKINSAKDEICVAFPWITYDPLVEALIEVKKRSPDIKIKVITSVKNHDNPKHAENLKKLDEHGVQILPIYEPLMHRKEVCVDGKVLITGSANATFYGADLNLEGGTVTVEKDAVERFLKKFEELWYVALLCGVTIPKDTARAI